MKPLSLPVGDADDGNNFDDADWVNAKFMVSGEKPQTMVARSPSSFPNGCPAEDFDTRR